MKRLIQASSLMVLSGLFCLAASAQAAPGARGPQVPMSDWVKGLPDVVASVEGEDVTKPELEQAISMTYGRRQAVSGSRAMLPPFTPQEEYDVLQVVMEGKALKKLATDAKVDIPESEVTAAVNAAIEQMGGEEQFAEFLKFGNLTRDEFADMRRTQLMQNEYASTIVSSIDVTEEEIKEHYDNLVAGNRMMMPPRAEIRHILIRAAEGDEAARSAAKKRIEDIRKRVVEGKEDFATVAAEVSEDPGSAPRGGLQMVTRQRPDSEELAFTLPIGEVSEPFESAVGWHIMVVDKRYDASNVTLEQARDQIRESILGVKRSVALREHVRSAMEKMEVKTFVEEPAAAEPADSPNEDVNNAFDALLEQSS